MLYKRPKRRKRKNNMNEESKVQSAILVNDFTEYGVECFKGKFDELFTTSVPVIPILIDSFGGEIYSLMAMLDIIESSDRPVMTVALGKAMSCGSVLLASGTPGYRFIGPNSTVMIHDAATVSWGKIQDLKADVGEAERLNDIVYGILDKKCKKPRNYFKKIVTGKKHVNWYLNANDALKHGVVDHVGIPVIAPGFSLEVAGQTSTPKRVRKTAPKKSKSTKE